MTTHNTQTLMVFCMLGVLALLTAVETGSLSRGGKAERKRGRDSWRTNADVDLVDLILDPTSMSSSVPLRQIGNDSLSPWMNIFNHDNSRYPPDIASATCLLKGCLTADGQEVMDLKSKPIFHQILVLRRVRMDHKTYAFKLETETVSVGCTCVRPSVIRQE